MAGPAGWSLVVPAPFGYVAVAEAGGCISGISLYNAAAELEPRAPQTPLATRAAQMLRAYLEAPGFSGWELPLAPAGTPFQQQVWAAIARIPAGQVRSYGALARSLGSGPRAVAAACGRNPYPLIIPCHRVVGVGGLCGYTAEGPGDPLQIKRWLLRHEGFPVD